MKQGWEIKRLDEIIESNIIGLTKNSSEQDIHHEFKYVKMNNITRDNCFDLSKYTCVNAKKEEVVKYSLSDGDFLFNTRNSYELVGKTCLFEGYNNEVILYNNNIMRIRFLKNINPFFINYAFSTDDLIKKLDRLKSGTTNVSAIYYKDLKNIELLIPHIHEQQRIVAILDEAFAAIAKAKANAEQNLKNAKELFESYLQGVFETKGEGWEEKRFEDLCDLITCGVAATPKYVDESEGVPFLSAQNVRDGEVVLDKYRFISKQFHQELTKKNKPKKGDILYSRVGSKFGEAGVVEHDFEFSVYVSLTLIKPKQDNLNSYFLKYYLNSPLIKDLAKKSISSSGVPNLNVKEVREFPIKFPSISIQIKLVNEIKTVSAETKKLEAIYQQKINDLEELKKSILQKAFAGELKTEKAVAL